MKRLSLSSSHLSPWHCSSLLQRCMKSKSLKACKQIHAVILTERIDMNSLSLSSRLIGAYACSGDLVSSKSLFRETPSPNAFAFNWMILTLSFSGFHEDSIGYFYLFQESRNIYSSPNKYTFSVILKACVGLMDLGLGRQIHSMICKMGFEMDVFVCNGLVDMYGKCGKMSYARQMFDEMPHRDVASWTAIICGYADTGKFDESIILFERMRLEGIKPNDFTWNAMVAGHARHGDCAGAFELFSRMGEEGLVPDLATWNAMISGFVQSQRAIEAIGMFHDMLFSGIVPNQVTLTSLLPTCGMVDSIRTGREIHGFMYRIGLEINVFVASALIDMYSKCGSVGEAWNVFNSIPTKNAASWNAMIGCFGKHGLVDSAVKLFERMQYEQIQANEVTLISVLSACSHGGLVDKGLEILMSMDSYGIKPDKEHCACVVDLLCRYGRMDEAYDVVKQIGAHITSSVIGAFLNGCKIHGRRDLAEKISEYRIMELKRPGVFVTLSNIFASEGKWVGVEDVRELMKEKGVRKKPGFSCV